MDAAWFRPTVWLPPTLLAVLAVAAGVVTAFVAPSLLAALPSRRSRHRVLAPLEPAVRLADVVGAAATTREVADAVHVFLHEATFREQMGGAVRRGLVFEGAPGTGKAYLARAMAAQACVPFLQVDASRLCAGSEARAVQRVRAFVRALRRHALAGTGAVAYLTRLDEVPTAQLRDLVAQVQQLDAPTPWQRWRHTAVEWCNRALPQQHRLRGPASDRPNVLLVAATTSAAALDPSLFGPGRFGRVIRFDLPLRSDRIEIAEYHLARKRHDHTVSAAFVADLTARYTPGRIEQLLDDALVIALGEQRSAMTYRDVIAAQIVGEHGVGHAVELHPDEKRRLAIHEAGHAIQAALLGRDVKLASVLRRAGRLGLVAHGEVEERFLRTLGEARDQMAIALAGRAAEIQELGEPSACIADDLATATEIAAQLVGALGGGDSLLSLAADGHNQSLVEQVLHDPRARARAEQVLHAAADRAACTVLEHRRALLALADALCELDELDGDQVHAIVAGAMVN